MEKIDTLVSFGDEVKALGDGKIGGTAVRYRTGSDVDAENDYFDNNSNFGRYKSFDLYFNHGQDSTIKKTVIGSVEIKQTDAGLWAEGILFQRNEYEKAIYKLVEAGKLGFSTGAIAHLVDRIVQKDGSGYLKNWPIAEISVTHTPAEIRNEVMPVKGLTLTGISPRESEDSEVGIPEAEAVHPAEPTKRKSLHLKLKWKNKNKK